MDALDRAGLHGFLDLVRRRPRGVHYLGESESFVHGKDLGADFFARAAGNTVIFGHVRNMVSQLFSLPPSGRAFTG
jgi:hypothetical protein